jgi:hypothetical protein
MNKYEVRLQQIGIGEDKWRVVVIPPTGYDHRGYIEIDGRQRCEAIAQGRAIARQHNVKLQIDE